MMSTATRKAAVTARQSVPQRAGLSVINGTFGHLSRLEYRCCQFMLFPKKKY